MKKVRLLLIFAAITAVCFYFFPSGTVDLVILHTNDHHGYCWSIDGKGGFAKQMTIAKEVRQKNKHVLFLSAGDINTGAPESDFNQAEPSFKGMNLLRFDAMALGNHEFDNPIPLLKKQEEWSSFPFLSANVYDKKTGKRLFKPYVIKQVDNIRIGILGLVTEEAKTITHVKYMKDVEFKDPIQEAKKVLPELKQQSDFIIALTHLGYYPTPSAENVFPGDIDLAKENPEISVIVGGHSHTVIDKPAQIGTTIIVQAGDYAKYLGELQLKISKKTHQLKKFDYVMHALDEKIPEDPQMISFLEPYLKKAQAFFDEKIGETTVPLMGERDIVRSQETNLGNLVTDLFRHVTKAEVGLQNGGGTRASIPKGNISYGDIRKAFPFNNTIVVLKLTGKELLDIINRSASLPRPSGGFLQVSGISFVIENNQAKNVKVSGKPVQLDKIYSVATNDFVAHGGDGYDLFKEKHKYDTRIVISVALKSYIKSKKKISPKVEGRIRFFTSSK